MLKQAFLVIALSFSFTAYSHAALTDAEKASVIESVLAGDVDVLDRIHDGFPAPPVARPCQVGCYAMTNNPIAVNACRIFLSPQNCMEQFNTFGCIWSCQ